ncbi:PAS sensor protein [Mycobacterium sp. 1274761.0]|nr:PAS sensor protein [Mycobacterium sp. 1274761.0]
MDALEGTRQRHQKQRPTVTVDRDGIIREWDDAVTDIAGYSADEALGRNLNVVIPPVLRSLHWRGFDKAMHRGRLSHPEKVYKVPALRSDRRIVVAHATFELITGRTGSARGAVVTFVGTGPVWQGVAWRVALAPINLVHRVVQRMRSRS